jgi:hypothetical protein
MRRALFGIIAFSIAVFLIILLAFLVDSAELKWGILAGALGLIAVGLTINNYVFALRIDSRMNEMDTTLHQITNIQEEIQKELKEQTEQKTPGPPLIASLQAMSQYYMDYINKQRGGEGKT